MLDTPLKASTLAVGLAIAARGLQMDETVPVATTRTMATRTVTSPGTGTAMSNPSRPLDETPITPRETVGAPSQD